ncbi:hypothetical protein [Paenibacillus puerhi]|nr:hypothetical protein [Paenibacillus puerhi]
MSRMDERPGKSPNYKENKYVQEESALHAEKAAKRPPSLNGVTKENNPQ